MTAPATPPPGEEQTVGPPWLQVDLERGLARLRVERYDEELIEQIRALPGRRFIRERREWVLPARQSALAQLAALLEGLGERVLVSKRARRRLDRVRPGRIEQHGGAFELTFVPQRQTLERVRALPERRYKRERHRWTVPATRAGALALLTLLDDGEFTATKELTARLARIAEERSDGEAPVAGEGGETPATRASPTPHWRHVTRGPIYRSARQRRQWIAGVGWCARVRVDPTSPSERAR